MNATGWVLAPAAPDDSGGINYVQYTYALWDDPGYWLLFALIMFQGFTIFVMGRTLDRAIRQIRQNTRHIDMLDELDRARGREIHTLRQFIGLRDHSDNGRAHTGIPARRPTPVSRPSAE